MTCTVSSTRRRNPLLGFFSKFKISGTLFANVRESSYVEYFELHFVQRIFCAALVVCP